MAKIMNPNDNRVDREDKIFEFIKNKQFYCAVAYANICKLREDEYNRLNNTKYDYFTKLYTALAYAFDDPWYIEIDGSNGCQYTSAIFDYIKNIDDIQHSEDEDNEQEDNIKIFESEDFKKFILLVVGIRILYSAEWAEFEEIKKSIDDVSDKLSISFIKEDVTDYLFNFINETCITLRKYSNKDKKEELVKVNEIKKNREKNIKDVRDLLSERGDTDFEKEIRKKIFGENEKIGKYLKRILDGKSVDIKAVLKDFIWEDSVIEDDFDIKSDIDQDKIENFVDSVYKSVLRSFPKFKNKDNKLLIENFKKDINKAIELIAFFNVKNAEYITDEDAVYLDMYGDILEHFKNAVNKIDEICAKICVDENDDYSDYYKYGLSILQYTLSEIEDSFSREKGYKEYKYEYGNNFYVPFLLTNDVVLNEKFLLDFPTFYENDKKIENDFVESIEPEFLIYEHSGKLKQFDYTVSNIIKALQRRYDDEYDNYGILKLIATYLDVKDYKNDNDSYKNRADKKRAKNQAEDKKEDFLGELELAHCYRQFDDVKLLRNKKYNECESQSFDKYLNTRDSIKKWYTWACGDNSNFGIFREIVKKYENAIHDNAEKNLKGYWLQRLEKAKEELDFLTANRIEKIENLINGHNFSSVSEVFDIVDVSQFDNYFHRTELNTFLADFVDDQQYNNCYKEVQMSDDDSFLYDCVDIGKVGEDNNKKSAKKLAKTWDKIFSSDGNKLDTNDLEDFLNYLGFKVIKPIANEPNIKFEQAGYSQIFSNLIVTLESKKREDIDHPIAAFGTKASIDGFRVIFVQGKKIRYESKNYLVDLIKQIGMAKNTIILLNHRLTIDERRSLAKLIKIKCNDKLFVVIDRVVMAFLMKKYDFANINEKLMSVVAPFGFYQPYTSDPSVNNIPEEVFIGRDKELKDIEAPSGSSIVYGGRQLGKSALLRQAEKDINIRNDGSKAIKIDVKGLDYIETVKEIAKQMKDKGILNKDVNVTNWVEFRLAIEDLLKTEKIPYLLLLIDEADKFFESCDDREKNKKDEPFVLIKRITENYEGKFKVVFAGLNMIKEYDFMVERNSIGKHFKKCQIGPFKPIDARELIEIPLHYLGLDFSADNESLIYLILENTNYYPCLIQLYCEKLLKLMTEDEYAGYKEQNSPIYNVSKEHIRKILSDKDFLDTVREKFDITLKLDEDDYYYYLALILALLCHKKYGYYSKEDFRKFAVDYPIEKISTLSDKKLSSLLNELVELDVLRKDKKDDNKYGFRRFRLFELMGTEEKIHDDLMGLMLK